MHELEVLTVGKKMTAAMEVDPQDEGEGIFVVAEAVVDLMVDEGERFEEAEDEDHMGIRDGDPTTTATIIPTTRQPPLGDEEEAIMQISVERLWIATVGTKVEKWYHFVRQQPRKLLKEGRKSEPSLKDEEGVDRTKEGVDRTKDEAEEAGSSILWEAVMAIETAEEAADALILNGVEEEGQVIREEAVEMMPQEILKVVEVTGCPVMGGPLQMICIVFLDPILVEEMKEAVVACHRKAAPLVDEPEEVGVVVRQLTDSTHLGRIKTFLQEKIVLQNEDETNRQRSLQLTTRTRE
jgi:hypothetical protein